VKLLRELYGTVAMLVLGALVLMFCYGLMTLPGTLAEAVAR
jgi:hypothetical protein